MLKEVIGSTEATSLIDLLHTRALQHPHQLAYLFQHDDAVEDRLTYGELEIRACAIAAQLQNMHQSPNARVLLFYPQGLEYIAAFSGCLYAGLVAVPSPHPHLAGLGRHLARLQGIVENARPEIVLTTTSLLARTEQIIEQFPTLQTMTWLATDTVTTDRTNAWREPDIQPASLAFLQYTSGSTSMPKGVMLSHANILQNNKMFQQVLQHPPESTFVSWLPLFHDMGLIASALQALYIGAPCILLSPQAFIQRPLRWLQAISQYRAYTSCAPNFAYELCARKVTPEQCAELDLSCWKNAVNGAEPVQLKTLEQFTAAFSAYGFRPETFSPGYGLAESTVFVACTQNNVLPVVHSIDSTALEQHQVRLTAPENTHARMVIGCGTGSPDQKIAIVDPVTCTQCATDQVGEIWVSGPSVAQGYWNKHEETDNTFRAYLSDTDEGPFLRTGDLGFLKERQLFITGRLKDVIIIDGRNHYPQDIELTVGQAHPAMRPGCCAAFAITRSEQEYLVIVAEVERHYRPIQATQAVAEPGTEYRSITRAIRKAVAEQHDLTVQHVVLLKPASIPKTSSGKIQRHACRQGFLTNTLAAWSQS